MEELDSNKMASSATPGSIFEAGRMGVFVAPQKAARSPQKSLHLQGNTTLSYTDGLQQILCKFIEADVTYMHFSAGHSFQPSSFYLPYKHVIIRQMFKENKALFCRHMFCLF